VDVSSVADVIITSLTKSFSGYANLLAGSAALNPASPHYASLKPLYARAHHNELFAGDAAVLLANSADYLARSAVLNRNAATLAARLRSAASDPLSPVTGVLYPPHTDTAGNYAAFARRATSDFAPGHGCLLSVDFEDVPTAAAFYDNLSFYHGPHLGAHHSLAMPFNATVFGRDAAEMAYHAAYGAREAQVRLSVGLEEERELLDTVEEALGRAAEARARRERGEEVGWRREKVDFS